MPQPLPLLPRRPLRNRRLHAALASARGLALALLTLGVAMAPSAAEAFCGSVGQRACCVAENGFPFGGCYASAVTVPQANSGLCSGFNPFGIQASAICVAPTSCGNSFERACCAGEDGFTFGGCYNGLNQIPQPNSGYCKNSSLGVQSSGVCVPITPCGSVGQRACCSGESGFGACTVGLVQLPQPNSGQCSNWLPGVQSSGVCAAVTACGGANQRACCVGENGFTFGGCGGGLNAVPQANSGQCGNLAPGIQSSSMCIPVTPCGGVNQRACCVGENGFTFGGCGGGLNAVPQANSGQCSNSLPGIQSSSMCVPVTPCGANGQRACCAGENGFTFGGCGGGLVQLPQPNSGQCSNWLPGIQSSGVCAPATPCGGANQRGCCVGENGFAFGGCGSGLNPVPQANSGQCTNLAPGIQSSSVCVPVTPCGATGQRACCAGENGFPFGGCDGGLVQLPQANSGQCANSLPGIQSSGVCAPATPCGGTNERACCVGENGFAFGGCGGGLNAVPQANSGQCTNLAPGIQSSSMCVPVTPCGGVNQRACCLFEADFGDCEPGLAITPQPNSGQCSNSLPGIQSSGICEAVTPCGHPGERACCFFEYGGMTCVGSQPSAEVPLPNQGRCANSLPGVESSGFCVATSACGGLGQRACCGDEIFVRMEPPCKAGLIEVPGCSGDCTCSTSGGISYGYQTASGMCARIEPIAEPTAGWSPPPGPPASPLRGFADLHVHLFTDLAHGGGVFSGKAFDPIGGVNEALKQDYGTDLDLVDRKGDELVSPTCPSFLGPNCGRALWHGDHTILGDGSDAVGVGTKDGGDHPLSGAESNLGAPIFNGWPTWNSTTHEQTYHVWLERAWRGGMRLMVMLAVNNEALCQTNKRLRGTNCDDGMAAIDAQLAEAHRLEEFIDQLNGGTGKGWFRIVTSPAQARKVIENGQLAVVLGIEMDNLFNCRFDERDPNTGLCTDASVRTWVNEYYGKGVRHAFPIHNFDNAFGSPATWQDPINVGNRGIEGRWWEAEDCPGEAYGFKLNDGYFTVFFNWIMSQFGFDVIDLPPPHFGDASCNKLGLSPLGGTLVDQMIQRGMIIDVDHMSNKALDETLSMVEAAQAPVVASHVQFFDLNVEDIRHERMRTYEQLYRIRKAGGMVAAMLKDDQQDTDGIGQKFNIPYGPVVDDCRHSSKTWAQAYRYAVDVMGGPVAFGSDFNGAAGHVGPRFGSESCGGEPTVLAPARNDRLAERRAQIAHSSMLNYPFTIPGFGSFDRQMTGQRTFDFNFDGLAHIGLLPDLIADLGAVGLSEGDLDPLFQSAEAYVAVWERAVAASACPNGPGNDYDGDGIGDTCDNCRYASNADQADNGGLGVSGNPDGIGDACQCGDVSGDGRVSVSDAVIITRSLLSPPTATRTRPERCDVGGSPNPATQNCSVSDAVIIRRSLLTPPTAAIQQVCAPAHP